MFKGGHDVLALKELPGQRGRQSHQQLVSDRELSSPTKACTGPCRRSERKVRSEVDFQLRQRKSGNKGGCPGGAETRVVKSSRRHRPFILLAR